ncbi:universal stress protein [Natronorubrum tibetense]|uniref:UspA domain-containing protein n=1 Tax=Natronorubrum tibetense GA33 TaxID=1114856 RepID=L9W814_9EURY|nr:universal stress protein [Natronorubrum tibetense]ELY45472.1 UspA domain-containing protein [Natronorubrum tibetense GA33]
MPSRILVPVDGSTLSLRALRHALREFPDADVTAYHVVDLFDPDPPGAGESSYEPMLGTEEWYRYVGELRDRIFDDVAAVAADYDRSVETDSDVGDPARLVLEYATDEPVDHVVIGAHGRPEPQRPIYGSVAETVTRRSPVRVTVVR